VSVRPNKPRQGFYFLPAQPENQLFGLLANQLAAPPRFEVQPI